MKGNRSRRARQIADQAHRGAEVDTPVRLPQRWALILSIAATLAVATGAVTPMAVSVLVALAAAGLLHQIMD